MRSKMNLTSTYTSPAFYEARLLSVLADRVCLLDRKDPESDHFLMMTTGPDGKEEDAGTIRWWPKPNQAAGKMGRVAGEFFHLERKVSPPRRANFTDR